MDARTTSVVSTFTRWLCGDGRNWPRTGMSKKRKVPLPERGIALSGWPNRDPGVESFATRERSACGSGSESERP
eukprot:5898943-Pleurochrysis_carterae.AAC.1